MEYFSVEPEVAGGLGSNTDLDTTVHPPRVRRLHYEFEDWLGDDLLETFPCFVVSQELADLIRASALDGVALAFLEVSVSAEGRELFDADRLPSFEWLQVTGEAGRHDVGVTENGRLVVSERAMRVIRQRTIQNAIITPFNG